MSKKKRKPTKRERQRQLAEAAWTIVGCFDTDDAGHEQAVDKLADLFASYADELTRPKDGAATVT